MVVSLQQGANDLQMVQMMPLPLYRLSLRQNPDWFNFSGVGLPRLTWKRGSLMGVCLVCV